MTDIIQELRGLIAACTKGDLSTAQRHIKAETVECPACHGDGEVEAADYCNIDGVALGVQFYGIGEQFGAHEKLWAAVSAHLPALLDRLEAAERGKAMRDARPNPDWPAATAAMVALAEHGMGADIGELLTHGNPSRGIAPGAIFKMIAAIDAALVGEG